MIANRVWIIENLISSILQSPAQINLFLMSKEILVQSSKALIKTCSNKHCSSCCPKYLFYIIILPFVLFQMVENPTPTKRITQVVYKTSSCSSVLKLISIFKRHKLRLAASNLWIFVHKVNYSTYPV